MSNKTLNSLDDFANFVIQTINPWTKEKRTVLAAAIAERWLAVYEEFSEKNHWGNPATFEDVVEMIWNCVLNNRTLTDKEVKVQDDRLLKDTPHLDDFDCEDVLTTSGIVSYALNACDQSVNTNTVVMALAAAVVGIEPILDDEFDQISPDLFQQRKAQKEVEKQLKLLEVIGNMDRIDREQIDALRQRLSSRDLRGPIAPKRKSKSGPTNKAIFEQYRKAVEDDLKRKLPWSSSSFLPDESNPLIFSIWGGRYLRRKHFIQKLADVHARDALVTKNSTHDAAVKGYANWDQMILFSITVSYRHRDSGYDVKSPEEPHGYGASFRRLCIERRASGALQWAQHVPPAWEEEDERKGEGLTFTTPELGKLLTRKLSWQATGDVDHPWSTEVGGDTWRVRLNDFPDEIMYTLIINDAVIGNFHDWPKSWQRQDVS